MDRKGKFADRYRAARQPRAEHDLNDTLVFLMYRIILVVPCTIVGL